MNFSNGCNEFLLKGDLTEKQENNFSLVHCYEILLLLIEEVLWTRSFVETGSSQFLL